MSQEGTTKISSIVLAGVVGVTVIFAIMVLLQVLYNKALEREYERKIVAAPPNEVTHLLARQREELRSPKPAPDAKVLVIPIERAMGLVVAELAAGKPLGGAPLPREAPADAAQPGSEAERNEAADSDAPEPEQSREGGRNDERSER